MLGQQPTRELVEALDRYRTKTSQSNIAFWTAKIRSLEQDTTLSDAQRLDLLAPYAREGLWPSSRTHSDVVSPSQLLIPKGQPGHIDFGMDSDGIIPPAGESEREEFLAGLKQVLNESSLLPKGQELTLPDEYCQLLTLTDAISDTDFADTGLAGLDGVCDGFLPQKGNLIHPLFYESSSQGAWRRDGWTVEGGWQCGIGNPGATELLFAHKKESPIESEKARKWRVCAWVGDCDHAWFDSIADWMDWRSDWLARLPLGWQDKRPGTDELDEDSDNMYGSKSDEED